MKQSPLTSRSSRAFTLLEVLIAVSVIIILIAAVFGVGQQVITQQRINQTKSVLSSLDRALEEYRIEARVMPSLRTEAYLDGLWRDEAGGDSPIVNEQTEQTFLGGVTQYRGEDFAWLPNAAYFLFVAQGYENIDSIIAGIPDQFSRTIQISDGVFRTQVVDSWENPVLFITPDNPLAQAIFGECPNDRPYFMSAGPDEKYGYVEEIEQAGLTASEQEQRIRTFREDNIYSVTPGPVDESFSPSTLNRSQNQ